MAGGGTGGHVYPAVAIADALRSIVPDAAVLFAGTRERMEWEAVPKAGYAIQAITVSGFQRRLTVRNVAFPFKLAKGLAQSFKLVGAFDPDVVVGTGGYVAGPVLLAGSLRRRPVVIQEQNAYAGLTNRLLARRAARIHIAFPEATHFFPTDKCVLSGNPTRAELLQVDRVAARRALDLPEQAAVLFVFGGSLGSGAINQAVETRLSEILSREEVYVLWQTGTCYFEAVAARIGPHPRLRIMKYVDRMDLTYAAADLALCRAGAITCSELMVTGTPAILVPSPNVTADHQTKNARSMADAGCAVHLPEGSLDEQMMNELEGLLVDEDRRRQMANAARRAARPDAAERIARDILDLARRPERIDGTPRR
jgi:UDP-N-acetylglucosamine--N-acetylmuramyl-(pentapeptide) pyrophosphoryl-undecaprenol N-acetylglucosamine transferase